MNRAQRSNENTNNKKGQNEEWKNNGENNEGVKARDKSGWKNVNIFTRLLIYKMAVFTVNVAYKYGWRGRVVLS